MPFACINNTLGHGGALSIARREKMIVQTTPEITGTTQILNILLRGELAATETYQEAMNVLDNAPGAMDLRRLHDEHREAANTLRLQIREAGGEPDHSAGPWGAWADIVDETARTLGQRTAALALKQGEELGVIDYEGALQNEHLSTECKALIHDRLLPHAREHLATLDRIIDVL
jgi:hypothetical protein